MFYSGWNFSSPRRMVVSSSHQSANCHVQDTGSPGISFLQFFPSAVPGAGAPARRGSDGSERLHVRSDVPIHPHSGVFYFEVELRAIGGGEGEGREGRGGGREGGEGREGRGGGEGGAAGEPALVIGVYRGGLPPHKLPGEEAHGVGLFTAQRMVYANGRSEGEAVRLPFGERHAKGMQVDDTVGCIVNLMDGSVRFTCNGELLSGVSLLSRRVPRHGYFPAVGVLRPAPALSLRVVLQPLGRAAIARPPALDRSTEAAGYFVFDVDTYSEQIADAFVRAHRQQTMGRQGATERGREGIEDTESVHKREKDDSEGASPDECKCYDGNIITAIRKHLASRGLTKALSAFEREQAELQCSRSASGDHATSGQEGTKSSLSQHGSFSLPSGKATAAVAPPVTTETQPRSSKPRNNGDKTVNGDKESEGKSEVTDEARIITYSVYIRRLRDDISCGNMLLSIRRIFEEGVLSPITRNKICSAVEKADELPPNFWGLIFFAQRCDMLFLLRAAHVVEIALSTMCDRLRELQNFFMSDRSTKGSKGNGAESEPNIKKVEKEKGEGEGKRSAGAFSPSPSVNIMELALRELLDPFEALSLSMRRHRRATASVPSSSDHGIEEIAFGERNNSQNSASEGLAAHLFSVAWGDPALSVTLLVRHSVPHIPPPRRAHQRAVVQSIAALVAHAHAVCAHMHSALARGDSKTKSVTASIDEWLARVDAARARHRARCWRLLLHAVEDFGGAVECRLLAWLRLLQQQPRRDGRRLFPSLRAAWRNVHASAALEPLLHVITRAFSEKLHRATGAPLLAAEMLSASFARGRKRGLSVAFHSGAGGAEEADAAKGPTENGNGGSGDANLSYTDDIRLSCLYMENIYDAVFA